jgi:hypothetical protein
MKMYLIYNTGVYWIQTARSNSDHRGKLLRRDAFNLAKQRYGTSIALIFVMICHIAAPRADEYKPLLKEVEKILEEAGLDEEEIKKSAAAGPANVAGQSRNRR